MLLGNQGTPYYSEGSQTTVPVFHDGSIQSISSFSVFTNHWGYWWLPAGRLPFTWYSSLANLPTITDYDVSNHTYRFNQYHVCPQKDRVCQEVIYPFGYGLTYNYALSGGAFEYRNLDLPTFAVSSKVGFTFAVEVVNRGLLASEEVIQVYLDWITLFGTKASDGFNLKYKAASRQLVGFERLPLFPGEVQRVRFVVSPEQLWVWSYVAQAESPLCPSNTRNGSVCGAPVPASGSAHLSVGGQQPLQTNAVNSNVVVAILTVIDH